ncbi:MAG: hypothetical protein IKB02_03790 [Clostridia bacterium]|nr:hypothetical protein [Clostridia bacterium]
MNLVGKKIKSNKYGLATIQEVLENKLVISIDSDYKTVTLRIPDAFENNTLFPWTALDANVQKYILNHFFTNEEFLYDVIHDKFGQGKAIKIEPSKEFPQDRVIFIKFESSIKNFPYPDVFYFKHLHATDQIIQKQIEKDITIWLNPPLPPQQPIQTGWYHCSNAFDTYTYLCKKFCWNDSMAFCFKRFQTMYASNATPEGFGVSFFVHNSLGESYSENYSWFNKVYADKIEEIWFCNANFMHNMDTRVIFLKTRSGYEFSGIYEPIKIETRTINGKERKVKIYKKISSKYPQQ